MQDGRVYRGAACDSDNYLLAMKIAFPWVAAEATLQENKETEGIEEQKFYIRGFEDIIT